MIHPAAFDFFALQYGSKKKQGTEKRQTFKKKHSTVLYDECVKDY